MTRFSLIVLAIAFSAGFAPAATLPVSTPIVMTDTPIVGVTLGATAVDTTLLVGPWSSGAPHNGQFQSPTGTPAWNGWTSMDLTSTGGNHWHADSYQVVSGAYSAWCGDIAFAPCDIEDPVGGYGINWDDILYWQTPVANPAEPCTVRVQAVMNIDVELGYDWCYLQAITDGGAQELWSESGTHTGVVVDVTHVFQPGDYMGPGADEVRMDFLVSTDSGWSDEDCKVSSAGALQLDDVVITLSNGTGYSHDFEDGTLGAFIPAPTASVGNFAKIWTNLSDIDPCNENPSPQVAFIDDGLVVPGTGGTPCLDWCYGPGGYVVNHSGGLMGPEAQLHNVVVSPPLNLPPDHDDVLLAYNMYAHNEITLWSCFDPSCPPNIMPWVGYRSVATGNPADLEDTPWVGPSYLSGPGPGTFRMTRNLADGLVAGTTHFQVALGVFEVELPFMTTLGTNSTPAPYYDNVRVTTFPRSGPEMWANPAHLARDGFPAGGTINTIDLGTNSVRFDMIADPDWFDGKPAFIAGDSVVVRIDPRPGAAISGAPQMHYRLIANRLFDPYRTSGLPNRGSVDCTNVLGTYWAADLPDAGFFFPGDQIHYYFTVSDDLGGDLRMTVLPADTTGFSGSEDPYGLFGYGYDPAFTVRALPTLSEDAGSPGTYFQPQLLLWHDSGRTDDWDEWMRAMHTASMGEGTFDIFDSKSNDPLGRALGTAASVDQLEAYDFMIYAGGMEDTSLEADVPLFEGWFETGDKDVFFTGGQIAGDLADGLASWTGVDLVADDIRPLLGDQLAPRVQFEWPNPVLQIVSSWLAFGECPDMVAAAAAVTVAGNGVRLAQYLDAQSTPDTYPYAAMILSVDATTNSRAITLPWDFALVHSDPDEGSKANATRPARDRILNDVLGYFGVPYHPAILTPVPEAGIFATSAHPNPFNPETAISYSVPRPGQLTVKVYNLRGALVQTLMDGHVEAAGSVTWDGTDAAGARVASGMYFYEARMHGEVQVGKLALVK